MSEENTTPAQQPSRSASFWDTHEPRDWIGQMSKLLDEDNARRQQGLPIDTRAVPQGETTGTKALPQGEITGLRSAIAYAEGSAAAAERAAQQDEAAVAALQAGGTTSAALGTLQASMEQHIQNAAHYRSAAADLSAQLQVTEAYEANKGAGTREFVTSE